jgi:hypothetical protein
MLSADLLLPSFYRLQKHWFRGKISVDAGNPLPPNKTIESRIVMHE